MSTSPITIRAGTAADTVAISELLSELNKLEGYDRSASPDELGDVLFHEEGGRVRMRVLVAERKGKLAGMVLYYWGYDTVSASFGYHLADIVVTQGRQREGMGAALYGALAEQCLAEGAQWISLTVLKKNKVAKQFYEAMGMVEVAVDFYAIGPVALGRLGKKN